MDQDHPDFVAAFARGLAIIEAFDGEHRTLTLTEAAARTGLSRGTVRRFLLTLLSLGYAASDGKSFWLLPRVLRLGYGYLSALDLSEIGQPIVQALSARLGESCSLGVLDGDDITFVARAEAKRNYRLALTIGGRLPAHATSLGRVLLAALPDAELDQFLRRVVLQPITPRTTTDKASLRAAILQARQDGYATVDDELQLGIRSVSVPVHDRSGAVVAQFAPRVSGAIVLRPLTRGVRQEPPVPVHVELGPDSGGEGLAEQIEAAVRATLVATVRVTLVPFNSLGRSEYKTKLLDFSDATAGGRV